MASRRDHRAGGRRVGPLARGQGNREAYKEDLRSGFWARGGGPPSGLSSTGNSNKEPCKEDRAVAGHVRLGPLGPTTGSLVVTPAWAGNTVTRIKIDLRALLKCPKLPKPDPNQD